MPIKIIFILFAFSINSLAKKENPLTGFTYMTPTGNNVKWSKFPVKLCFSNQVPKNIVKAAQEASEFWNKKFDLTIFDFTCTLKSNNYSEEDISTKGIYWINKSFEKYTDKTSFARTFLQFNDDGNILDVDIILNGEYYNWDEILVDAKTIFIHELGHVLGLKHYFISLNSSMNYYPYITGIKHYNLGEYETLVFTSLYRGQKTSPEKYMAYYFSKEYNKSIDALNKIKDKKFDHYYALGYLHKLLKNYNKAVINLKSAVKIKPNSIFARYQLGDSLWSLKKETEAEQEFKKVIEIFPQHYESLANLGLIMLNKNKKSEAIDYWSAPLKLAYQRQ